MVSTPVYSEFPQVALWLNDSIPNLKEGFYIFNGFGYNVIGAGEYSSWKVVEVLKQLSKPDANCSEILKEILK